MGDMSKACQIKGMKEKQSGITGIPEEVQDTKRKR